jgi:hypothetical protein
MKRYLNIIEAPCYLLTIGVFCMSAGAKGTAAFLFIVSMGRLIVNIIEDKK